MNELEQNLQDYEDAAQIAQLDFSQLTEADFDAVEFDDDGAPYGMVMGVPVAINQQPPQEEGSIQRDVARGVTRGAQAAGEALNEFLPMLGTPVDLVNEGLREVGDFFGVDLASDNPVGGSAMIRDGVQAVLDFGDKLLPQGANEAYAEFVNEPPLSPIVQSIVEEVSKFGVQAVTPAMYLRAFSVMSPFARGLAWGGIADFINAQPDDTSAIQSVTELLSSSSEQERGAVANAVLQVISQNENDPEIVNRARMALDGMVVGGAIEKGAELLIKTARAVPLGDVARAVGGGAMAAARGVNQALDYGVDMMGGGNTLGMGVGPVGDGPRRVGTTGQYVGGPPGLDSPQRLAALRRNMTALAQEGEPGRFWYERSGRAIMDMVGGDRDEAEKIAQAIAITSAGSTPVPSNFDFAMQAYAQYKAGDPIRTGKFPQNMSKQLNEAFYGEGWNGRKTNNFYNNIMREIDPTRAQGATIDIHMMRAFGFTNKDGTPYSGTPTDAQYTFVENEVKRIADQLGWEPQQVQAGIWVANKARNLGKPASEMTFDYADAAERNLGQISWESIPGRAGGHLREIFDAPYEQQAEYHVAVSKAFLDDDGNDLIAKRLGLPSPGDFEAPGYFEGKVSPGTQTEIIAPRQYQSKQVGQIEPATEDLINAYAAARGILMKQDGVGWHRPFYKSLKREANGYEINLGRPLSEDETMRVAQAIEGIVGHGEYAPIAAPEGVRIINFDYLEVDNIEFVKIIQQALDVVDFDEDAEYVGKTFHAYAGYAGNDWTVNPNGEGYYNSRWAGRPDLQGRVRDVIAEIGPRIDEVDLDFSERYGWTRNEALNAGYRNPAEVSDTNATQ